MVFRMDSANASCLFVWQITAPRLSTSNQAKPVKRHLMSKIIATLYAVMDRLRALSFVMALLLAGCMFWDPSRFAAKTSELENLAWFIADVGRLCWCDSRRGLSSAEGSLARGFFAHCLPILFSLSG